MIPGTPCTKPLKPMTMKTRRREKRKRRGFTSIQMLHTHTLTVNSLKPNRLDLLFHASNWVHSNTLSPTAFNFASIRSCPAGSSRDGMNPNSTPSNDQATSRSIPLRVCRPERTSSRLGNPELGNRWSDRHGQTPGVRRCMCPARHSAEGWGIIGYWVQNSANMYKYHQGISRIYWILSSFSLWLLN